MLCFYFCAKQLFYTIFKLFFRTMSNVSMNEEVDDSESISIELDKNNSSSISEAVEVTLQQPQKIKKIINEPVASNVDKVLEHLSKKQKISHSAMDAVDMLMMSHAKTIKTFSTKRQAIAKKQISELISNLELEQIEEDECRQYQNNYFQQTQHGIDRNEPLKEHPGFPHNYEAINLTGQGHDFMNL